MPDRLNEQEVAVLTNGCMLHWITGFTVRLLMAGKIAPLTRDQAFKLRDETLRDGRNMPIERIPMDQEATILRQALEETEKIIDAMIAKGFG